MLLRKLAVLSAIPFFMATLAVAAEQAPPPASPNSHIGDHAARHQQMCVEQFAKHVGKLAYLEAKLDLTETQRPLFEKWRQSILEAAAKQRTACQAANVKGDARPTIVDRQKRQEQRLAARLQSLQASRPALQSLYDALSPAQRETLDRRHHHHLGGRWKGRMMQGHGPRNTAPKP